MYKKIMKQLIISIMMIVIIFPLTASAAEMPNKSGFIWGVNGHNRLYAAYPESALEQQVKLAAELGSKIYRFNFNPSTSSDLRYMDKVVQTVDEYGMELLLVMDDSSGTNDAIKSRFNMVAERYNGKKSKGKISYIQIFNEIDIPLLLKKFPVGAPDGSEISHYNESDLNEYMEKFKYALSGVTEADNNVKSIINISYYHYGMLSYFQQKGLKWDIIGLDYYGNMGAMESILNRISQKFTHDIIICESNIWPASTTNHNSSTDWKWLMDSMKTAYSYSNRVKGMIFYELLDEMNFEHDVYEPEAHFGLVNCDKKGNIGTVKPIYTSIQKMIGGGPVTKRTVNYGTATSSAQPTPSSAPSSVTTASKLNQNTISSASEILSSSTETSSTESIISSDTLLSKSTAGEISSLSSESKKNSSSKKVLIIAITGVILILLAAGTTLYLITKKKKSKETNI